MSASDLDVRERARTAVLSRFQWRADHADPWPIFADPTAFSSVIDGLAEPFADDGVTAVVGVESRGFLLGGAVALRLGVGFVPVRKREGLFPGDKVVRRSDADYRGISHVLRVQEGALSASDRVLLVDDWLETASQLRTAAALVTDLGATVVGCSVIVDQFGDLTGGQTPPGIPRVASIVTYNELPAPNCCST